MDLISVHVPLFLHGYDRIPNAFPKGLAFHQTRSTARVVGLCSWSIPDTQNEVLNGDFTII